MKHKGWFAYFWFILAITALDVSILIYEPTGELVIGLIGLPFVTVILLAVWGISQKKVFLPWLWSAASYVCALWYVFSIAMLGESLTEISVALLWAPGVVAVFAYKRWLTSRPVEI